MQYVCVVRVNLRRRINGARLYSHIYFARMSGTSRAALYMEAVRPYHLGLAAAALAEAEPAAGAAPSLAGRLPASGMVRYPSNASRCRCWRACRRLIK